MVGPDGLEPAFAKGTKGKPKPPTGQGVLAHLTISGGLIATSQPVILGDGGLIQEAGDITLGMVLSNTHAQEGAGIDACVRFAGKQAGPNPDFNGLFATLIDNDLPPLKNLWLEIHQNTLNEPSLEDAFTFRWEDENGQAFNAIMGHGLAETVVTQDEGGDFPHTPLHAEVHRRKDQVEEYHGQGKGALLPAV